MVATTAFYLRIQGILSKEKVVVLVDGDTYSNGELIAEGVRRMGLGVLIGTRTSGAGIWVNSGRTLVV
ncbi:S41 family peptidase [Mesorhizobium sp. M1005]|uniref:S41 family peptidase n=1 Tax=unclassified Mesorhizobium TaxID=325217 RepID=UPI0033367F91